MNDSIVRLMIYKIIQNRIETEGVAQIKVIGDSMLPTLLPKDIITIKPSSGYSCGDILVFFLDGRIIVHRLIKRYKDFYITKGDKNVYYDEKVPKNQVLGRIICWNSAGCQLKFTTNFIWLKIILYLSKGEVLLSANKKWQQYVTKIKDKALKTGKIYIDRGANSFENH